MKKYSKLIQFFSVVCILSLLLSGSLFAQEERKIKMDEYKIQLAEWQARESAAKELAEVSEKFRPEYVAAFLDYYADDSTIELSATLYDTVERLTGKPPRTFQVWAQENRSAFIP